MMLLDTGLRISELANLQMNDLDLNEGIIKVKHAKGNKERLVPIGSVVQKLLWKYINHSRPQTLTNNINNVFLNDFGLPLSKNGIQQLIRRYGKKAGLIGVRCSPHTFRHTFAKNYLLNGGDIFSLQKILGHSSSASVRNYLNLFSVDVKNQHRRFSPVDNFVEIRKIIR